MSNGFTTKATLQKDGESLDVTLQKGGESPAEKPPWGAMLRNCGMFGGETTAHRVNILRFAYNLIF